MCLPRLCRAPRPWTLFFHFPSTISGELDQKRNIQVWTHYPHGFWCCRKNTRGPKFWWMCYLSYSKRIAPRPEILKLKPIFSICETWHSLWVCVTSICGSSVLSLHVYYKSLLKLPILPVSNSRTGCEAGIVTAILDWSPDLFISFLRFLLTSQTASLCEFSKNHIICFTDYVIVKAALCKNKKDI